MEGTLKLTSFLLLPPGTLPLSYMQHPPHAGVEPDLLMELFPNGYRELVHIYPDHQGQETECVGVC